MFGRSREISEALQATVQALTVLADGGNKTPDNVASRLEGLELSRAKWEAEMEAQLIKAQAKYQAASNAESRARTQVAHYEKIASDIDPHSEATDDEAQEEGYWPDNLRHGDAEGGDAEGVHSLHVGVEAGTKARAVRAKFS